MLLPISLTYSKPNFDSLLTEAEKKSGIERINFYRELVASLHSISIEQREYLYNRLINHSYDYGDKIQIARALSNYGYFLTITDRYNRALDTIEIANDLFKQSKLLFEEAFTNSQLALVYQRLGDYDKAVKYNLTAYNAFSKDDIQDYLNRLKQLEGTEKDSITRILKIYTIILTDFGLLFYDILDYDSAMDKFKECLDIARQTDDLNRIAGTLSNMAMIEEKRNNFEFAKQLYIEALEYAEKVGNIHYIANIHNNIGNVYSQLKQYELSVHYYKKAMDEYFKNNFWTGFVSSSYNLGLSYLEIGKHNLALNTVKSAYDTAVSLNALSYISRGSWLLSNIFDSLNNYKEAYYYHKVHKKYSDSLNSSMYGEDVAKLKTDMEFARKEAQISVLSAENSKKKAQTNFLIITVILILIIVAVLINRYFAVNKLAKLIKKQNEELELMNEDLKKTTQDLRLLNATKDKFFSIIAHDIRNPLSVIIGISSLIKDKVIEFDTEEYSSFNDEILKSAKGLNDLLQNLLLWSLSQRNLISFNPESIQLKALVGNIINLFELTANHKQVQIINNVIDTIVIKADLNMLSTIVRNVISNALKYSNPNSKVLIDAIEDLSEITITVKDFGIGMSEDKIRSLMTREKGYSEPGTMNESGTGLGMVLVNELLAYHDAQMHIESELGIGTTVTLKFPKLT